MIPQLSNNPFRMLGVCSNAPVREIVANKDRMNVFLKVGKETSFPLDLVAHLGELQRTPESIAAADSQLTIEKDRLLAAQFWFIRMTPADDEAFAQLSADNIDNAIEIWSRDETLSSLQNRAVCHLVKAELPDACRCISVLYERFSADFGAAIAISHDVTGDMLMNNFISALIDRRIDDVIALSLQDRKSGDQLAAGRKLIQSATEIIAEIKGMVPEDNQHLIDISDKVLDEVEGCCDDYISQSVKLSALYEVCRLFEEASSFALSPMAKAKYKEYHDDIKEMIGAFPPLAVKDEHEEFAVAHDKYFAEIRDVDDVETMLNNLEKRLKVIEQKVGADNIYYVKLSSLVAAQAMSELITQFNKAVKNEDLSTFAKIVKEQEIQENLIYTIRIAWHLTKRIGELAMDKKTLEFYNERKETFGKYYSELKKAEEEANSPSNKLKKFLYSLIVFVLIFLLRWCASN